MEQNQIIGRKKEQKLLQEYYESGRAEFIALYGRRRVGKTFLIRRFFNNSFTFDMTGVLEGGKHEQMSAFHAAMKSYGYTGNKCTTWLDMFFALRELLEHKLVKGQRMVIFIDELPCLDTPKAGFIKSLGHFWNSWANWQPEIMLIVCGSATSWMVHNVIDNHGGLHDRVTHEMALKPFTLFEAEEYFHAGGYSWPRLSVLQAYMAVGGVPYYMSLFHPTESPAMAINRLFFSENAEMAREYRRLFSSLFRNAQPYLEIIACLAKKKEGLTREELSQMVGTDNNGRLGNMLTDLIYCDFVRKYYVRDKRVKVNSAIYQLIDFYTIFYNTFLSKVPHDEQYWIRNLETPKINVWNGLAYERVCQIHLPQIKRALGIANVRTEHYAWRSKQTVERTQIDMIIDRADNTINLCEVKFSKDTYQLEKGEYLRIRHRMEAFQQETGTRSAIIPTLITTFGVAKGLYSDQIVVQLTLDDLFH